MRLRRLRADSANARPASDTLKSKADSLGNVKRIVSPAAPDSQAAPRDSVKAAVDSAAARARSDSLARVRLDSIADAKAEQENRRILAEQRKRADTLKTPTPAAEMPHLTELGDAMRWGRDELAATGSLTLGDLLERVPGLTVFRTGWIGSPQVGAMLGDFQKLRIFYDGIELDALDPRTGGMLDLSFVQIWQLEEVRIERGASEVRVHLRSWRVRSTTPSTRVDIGTGDLETNGYRGYFGKRFDTGAALQVGAAQIGTRDNRGAGDADGLSLFGRVGWAKGRLSTDASFVRTSRDRTEQERQGTGPNLPAFDGYFTEAYARVAYTDTTLGAWVHLTAAELSHSQNNLAFDSTVAIPLKPTPSRLTPSRQQLIASGGWGRGPVSLSLTGRSRRIDSLVYFSPSARLAIESSRFALAGFAEQQGELKLRRMEGMGRVLPFSWLAVAGAVSYNRSTVAGLAPTNLTYRGEVGLRLHRAWLSAGRMSRDTALLIAPIVFDTALRVGRSGAIGGSFVTLRGKFWKDVGFDVSAIKWDSAGLYRPGYQTRSQLYLNTGWRSRFPSGNFNVLVSVTHEYRTQAYFQVGSTLVGASQYRTLDAQLEIRLLQATLSYQFRNMLNEQYQQVPGFFMNRPVQYYGVRWYFYN